MRGRVVALMLIAALSMSVAQYSAAAQWFSDYFLRRDLKDYSMSVDPRTRADKDAELIAANEYNEALAQHRIQLSDEASDPTYQNLLAGAHNAIMATVSIPKIDVILPVMHGTTDDVLAIGAGHYYGSSLPVGGPNTHTAITAHSGLVTREYFTHLPDLTLGDEFIINSVAGELHYQVIDMTQVRADEEQELIDFASGRDLATLVTCVPIGINTHRLLVTGERIAGAGGADQVLSFWRFPGFPWWAVWILAAILFAWIVGRFILVPYWREQDEKQRRRAIAARMSAKRGSAIQAPTVPASTVPTSAMGGPIARTPALARQRAIVLLLVAGIFPGWVSELPIVDPAATYQLVIRKHADTSGNSPNIPGLSGAWYSVERITGYDFNNDGVISPSEGFDLTDAEGWRNASLLTTAEVTQGGTQIAKSIVANEVTNEYGVAVVSELPAGLYLVTETTPPSGYRPSIPFLVTLPTTDPNNNDSWLSVVTVYPKNQLIPPTDEPPPPSGPRPPTGPARPTDDPRQPSRPNPSLPSRSPNNPTGLPVASSAQLNATDQEPQKVISLSLFKTGISMAGLLAGLAALFAALLALRRRRADAEAR